MRRFLQAAAHAAQAAADAVTGLQGAEPVGVGADGAPTEAADRAAENAALDHLLPLGFPVLSEEAGLVHGPVDDAWIALDPLDGSRNFRAGLAPYATSIGLIRDGRPVAGFVLDHTTGRHWSGVADEPVKRRGGSRMIAVPSPDLPATLDYPGFGRVRISGSTAIDLCRVADGTLAAFDARHRDVVHVHDLAGPLAVLTAAGAFVRTLDGDEPVLRPDAAYCQRLVAAGSLEDLDRLLPPQDEKSLVTVGIRAAAGVDRDAVTALLRQLGYDHPAESVAAMLAEIDADPHQHLLVAVDADRVVGLLDLNLRRQLHHCAYVGQIDALVVDESARGRSVGAALVDRAAEIACAKDADVLELGTALHRTRALHFYEQHGFRLTSRKLVRPLKPGAH
jgi:fructose-1,6-bisphosphatase/inositol monophosphatase family enzyme/ribosomal protein S18 acetylase RimI-like enzyme